MWDLLIILTIIMLAVVGYSWLKSRAAEVVTVRAMLLRKRVLSADYYATFGMPGREQEFVVPRPFFFDHDEGIWGELTYQGEIFRSFIPEPTVAPPDPVRPARKPLDPDYDGR